MKFSHRLILIILLSLSANVIFGQANIDQLNEQLTQAREAKDFTALANIYLAIADFEKEKYSNHEKAFDYYTRSQEYFKLVQDSVQFYAVKQKIANHFRLNGQFAEALNNYNESINYLKSTKDFNRLATCYLDMAILHSQNQDFEKQIKYLDSILMLKNKQPDTLFNIQFNFEKIKYYETVLEQDSARSICRRTYELSEKIDDNFNKGKSLFILGKYEYKAGKRKEALALFKQSEEFLKSRSLDPIKLDLYNQIADVYEGQKKYDDANDYIKRYSQLNDSLLNRERTEAINNLSFKYEAREKTNEIKLLEKENELVQNLNNQQRRALYVLGAGLGLLALGIYFIIQFFRTKIQADRIISKQRDRLDKQKIKDLENEVKISSMQSVIEGQELERERIAKDLHDSLGGLLSAVKLQFEKVRTNEDFSNGEFDNAQGLLDTAVDEVRSISRNLQPGSLKNMGLVAAINDLVNRYVGDTYPDIDFQHYNISRDMDNMLATSIYRIIQELLNNAIKYAKASEIIMQLNKEDDEIVISFEDDGVGFNTKSFEKGMGLENVQSRVKYLKGDLQIDSQENVGTSYLIRVKI